MAGPHIALMGRARAGKDTVASHLCEAHGYKRVAFADPLKEMALKVDPIVGEAEVGGLVVPAVSPYRLSDVVDAWGWERSKDEWPDARRFLQNLGSAVRDVLGEDVWLQRGLSTASYAMLGGSPVVFTDVRYRNEASALRNAGFTMVRIERPASQSNASAHASETELDDYAADVTLINDGSVSDLCQQVDGLVGR